MNLGRMLLKVAGAALAVLVLAVLVVKWRVATVLDQAIAQAAPFASITRGSSFVGLDGTIGVTQVAITPVAQPLGTLRFARLSLQTPGLGWILRQALPGSGKALPERFGMSIDGLDTSLVDLDADTPTVVGTHSGALFEQAGCQVDGFSEADLASFGLPREPTRIAARYAIAPGGALQFESSVERAGSASTRLVLRLRLAGSARPDAAGLLAANFEGLDLELRDEGFVAARNTACAEITRQPPEAFLAAHLTRAKRLARAVGVAPDAAAWAAYAAFARDGGELVYSGALRRPLPLVALQQAAGPDGLLLDWNVRRDGGALQRVAIDPIPPEPLASAPRTLAQQIQAEMDADRARQASIGSDGDAGAALAPNAPPVPVPAAAPAPAPAPAGAARATAPATKAAPGTWSEASYESLSSATGVELRVETVHGSRRQGTLERWNPAGMVLRLDAREGGIPLSLSPRDLRRIERREPATAGTP